MRFLTTTVVKLMSTRCRIPIRPSVYTLINTGSDAIITDSLKLPYLLQSEDRKRRTKRARLSTDNNYKLLSRFASILSVRQKTELR